MRKLCLCFALLLTINSFAFTAASGTGTYSRASVADDHPLQEFVWD